MEEDVPMDGIGVAIVHARVSGGDGLLIRLVQQEGLRLIGEYSVPEWSSSLNRSDIDLVLADLDQIPSEDPVSSVRRLIGEKPFLIILSSNDKHAVRAIQLHALDYLVKPVTVERMQESLRWAVRMVSLTRAAEQVPLFHLPAAQRPLTEGGNARLMVKSRGRIFLPKVCDISWIEADGGYVRLHCPERKYMLRGKISDVERSLSPEKFVRIHRSTLVNVDRIREIIQLQHGEYAVLLQDDTRLQLSRSFRDRVFHLFMDVSRAAV